jgi:hypothetical protein
MSNKNMKKLILERFKIVIDTLSPMYYSGSNPSIEMLHLIEDRGTLEIQLAENRAMDKSSIANELLEIIRESNNLFENMLYGHNKSIQSITNAMRTIRSQKSY